MYPTTYSTGLRFRERAALHRAQGVLEHLGVGVVEARVDEPERLSGALLGLAERDLEMVRGVLRGAEAVGRDRVDRRADRHHAEARIEALGDAGRLRVHAGSGSARHGLTVLRRSGRSRV